MCDRDVVERAAALLGTSSISESRKREDERGWRPTHRCAVSGHRAAVLMRALQPLMGQRRQRQIEAALRVYRPIRLVAAPAVCIVSDCDRPHESRGLCHKHYMAWHRARRDGKQLPFQAMR